MSSPVGEWGGMSVFAGWGWCWLGVVLTKLVDDVVKSVDCGDCWQNWMILMMTWDVFTGAGCAMSWMTVYFDSGGRWLGHWMVGNWGESECVCVWCWLGVGYVTGSCVCVGGGGGGSDGCWQNWMIMMMTWYVFTGTGFVMSWMTVYWLTGERWLRHWMVGWVRCVWCWLGVG